MLAAGCEDPGWRSVPPERGQKEIRSLKQEEIVVPPGVFPKGSFGLDNFALFETIRVRLSDRVETSLVYSYANDSTSDYILKDAASATLVEVKEWGDWIRNPDYRIDYPVLAPAGKTVLLMLSASYDYSGPLKKGEEPTPQEIAAFLRDRAGNLYRFFMFDPLSLMKVSFSPGEKPNALEIFGHFPEYFTHIGPKRRACFSMLDTIGIRGSAGDATGDWKTCLIGADGRRLLQ